MYNCDQDFEDPYIMCPGRDLNVHDTVCQQWHPIIPTGIRPREEKATPFRDEEGVGRDEVPGGGDGDPPIPAHESVYEFTLTTTVDDPYQLRMVLDRIAKSAAYEIVHLKACIELTKAGLPHLHAILYSTRKLLDASKIKRWTPYRYELKKVYREEAFLNYIKKENGNPIISDYCSKKGIPQFWEKWLLHGQEQAAPERREVQQLVEKLKI